jgi:hypothetical protein
LPKLLHIRTCVGALDDRCCSLLISLFYRPDPAPYAEIAAPTLDMPSFSIDPIRACCRQKLRRLLANADL